MCTPTYFTCCLTFGIFAYVMHDDDFRRNTFYFCKLLRDISSEHRKGDEYDWIELLPLKNELVLWRDKCIVGRFKISSIRVAVVEDLMLKSDTMATVRNASDIDPAKLAFEIDANGRIKAKYDGLQGLMMYAPPMVTINPCINTEQGKAWSDEKKAFVMEENGGFYTLDLTDLSAVDGQTNPAADEFLKLLEALDAKFCEFVQQNQAKLKVSPGRALSKDQISVLQTPSVRIKVDKESGQAFYKYLNMRIRTQTMAGKRKTIPVVDMSNYLITERATIGTGDLVAALVKIDTAYAIPEGKFGLKWSFLAVQQCKVGPLYFT
eukprot:tig00020608_g11932.t1